MKRYLIEEAKCGLTGGGFACGPVAGSVVVTVRFDDGGGTRWLTVAECDGIPNFFLLDRDVHDKAVEEDDKTLEWMGNYFPMTSTAWKWEIISICLRASPKTRKTRRSPSNWFSQFEMPRAAHANAAQSASFRLMQSHTRLRRY